MSGYCQRECEGKKDYATQEAATKDARLMAARHRVAFNVYPCRFCARWHIGRARRHGKHIRLPFMRPMVAVAEMRTK